MSNEKIPQYKELTFRNQSQLDAWLHETTHWIIELTDEGQDLLKLWIAANQEIINTNTQQSVWCGTFVNMISAKKDSALLMWNPEKEMYRMMDFTIEKVYIADDFQDKTKAPWR